MKRKNPWLYNQRFNPGEGVPSEAFRLAFKDIVDATQDLGVDYALVGGQALLSHGIPRDTTDVDIITSETRSVAIWLVANRNWIPMTYDEVIGDFVQCCDIVEHTFADPVLYEVGTRRSVYLVASPLGVRLDLLLVQHEIEVSAVLDATQQTTFGVSVMAAPLGSILLLKAKAARRKDLAAIETVAEFATQQEIAKALTWASARDPEATRGVRRIIEEVRGNFPIPTKK